MKARAGDWLVVKGPVLDHGGRRGQIVALRHEDGTPPYVVRWLDTGTESLVFPGPDAHVVSAEEESARCRGWNASTTRRPNVPRDRGRFR